MMYKLFNKNLYRFGISAVIFFSFTNCGGNQSGKGGAGITTATAEQKDCSNKMQTAAFDLIAAVNALGSVNYGTEWYGYAKDFVCYTDLDNPDNKEGSNILTRKMREYMCPISTGSVPGATTKTINTLDKRAGENITQKNSALCKFFDKLLVDVQADSINEDIKNKFGMNIAIVFVAKEFSDKVTKVVADSKGDVKKIDEAIKNLKEFESSKEVESIIGIDTSNKKKFAVGKITVDTSTLYKDAKKVLDEIKANLLLLADPSKSLVEDGGKPEEKKEGEEEKDPKKAK